MMVSKIDVDPPWEHLHPGSVLVNLVPRMVALARNLWPLLLALWFGGRSGAGELIGNTLILLLFFGSAFGSTALHAITLRYRVCEGKLEIKSGLFNRQARVIAVERIQNVERVQNLFHRMSGLVEVRIETASGTEVEGLLSAIDVAAADQLTEALTSQIRGIPKQSPLPDDVLVHNTPIDLVWAGAADLRLGAAGVLIAALIEFLPQFAGEDLGEIVNLPKIAWAAVAIAVVSGAWFAGIASTVLRYYGFSLSRTERGLVAEQGLITRRRSEVRSSKVQLLTFVEPLLTRAVGLGALQIETAAAPIGGSGTERGEITVPTVDRGDIARLCTAAIPLALIDPTQVILSPPHPDALPRALLLSTGRGLALALGGLALFGPRGGALFALLPLWWLLSWLDVANQGWLVTEHLVLVRRGILTRTTQILPRDKLQSAVIYQGPLLSWRRLGLLSLRVAGSRVLLPPLGIDLALSLQRQLLAARTDTAARSGHG